MRDEMVGACVEEMHGCPNEEVRDVDYGRHRER